MENTTEVKFSKYIVHQMIFKINDNFDFTSKQGITLNPKFKREVTKLSDMDYRVNLSVLIEEDNKVPFTTFISISGDFKYDGWEHESKRQIIIDNSTSVLFPYLRTTLSNLTLNANITPYVLPLVNINRLFKDKI
jgi:preprotein translocase subunit SecB